MPRATRQREKVRVRFVKAKRPKRPRASERLPEGVYDVGGEWLFMHTPSGKPSQLALYVEENRSSGLPIRELIEQFQTYDCDHGPVAVVAVSRHSTITVCAECGLAEKKKVSRD